MASINDCRDDIKTEANGNATVEWDSLGEFLDRGVPPARFVAPRHGLIVEWLSLFIKPGQVTEARFIEVVDNPKYPSFTVSGYFDHAHLGEMATEIARWSSVAEASYFVFNPVDPELLNVANNRTKKKPKSTTEDKHVLRRTRIVVDSDPKRISLATGDILPPAIPSTEGERVLAFARIAMVARWLVEEQGWPEPMLCDSGNGFHAWWEVDLPRDDGGLVEKSLKALDAKFSDDRVSIDIKVFNPARLIKAYGSQARKGDSTDDRPHRFTCVLWRPAESVIVADALLQALAAMAPKNSVPVPPTKAKAAPAKAWGGLRATSGPSVEDRARLYLAKCAPAIQGDDGSGRCFYAACKVGPGFDLEPETALRILMEEYNPRCQPVWSEKEMRHKVEGAYKKETQRGFLRDADRKDSKSHGNSNGQHDEPPPDPIDVEPLKTKAKEFKLYSNLCGDADFLFAFARVESEKPGDAAVIRALLAESMGPKFKAREFDKMVMPTYRKQVRKGGHPDDSDTELMIGEMIDDPHMLGRLFLHKHCTVLGVRKLAYHRQEFHLHDGTRYDSYKDIEEDVVATTKEFFDDQHQVALMRYAMAVAGGRGGEEKPPILEKVTTAITKNTLQAIRSDCCFAWGESPPCWIGDGEWADRNPLDILAAQNLLVHLPTLETLPHTPRLFSPFALSYPWEPSAPKPVRWERFLSEELWPGDPESVRELQKWFGLCLTLDTRYQKILMIIGPPRSGKGTILRVLAELIGLHNTTNPSLPGLARPFGLWPLLDKALCVFSDAHALGSQSDRAVVLEMLLKISGEDAVSIDRKHREPLEAKLNTRLMFIGNKPPDFRDTTGALIARLVPLQLKRSWKNKEDKNLTSDLIQELPGILRHFAVDGLEMLKEDRGFRIPKSAKPLIDQLSESLNPMSVFVEECLTVYEEGKDERDIHDLPLIKDCFGAYVAWCRDTKREIRGENVFGQIMHTVVPQISVHRPDNDRRRRYRGIDLNAQGQEYLKKERDREARSEGRGWIVATSGGSNY